MKCLFVSVSCVAVLSGGAALGADYYVSTSGVDTDPGTLSQPWRTIQKAAGTVVAGDTVYIRGNGGVFTERVLVSGRDGTAAAPIVFKTYPGDPTAVIETTITATESGIISLFSIENSDYITVQNLELRNCKTTGTNAQQKNQQPMGIQITGDGKGIVISGCKVHDIWQSSTKKYDMDANGFGIGVFGTSSTAIDGLVLDGNEVYNLRTGASESVVLNGNVTSFTVTGNRVHDCNNIGIDFIGFEGVNSNSALDQARSGVCSGNEVYNIDSKFNPAYGGNFSPGGGNATRSAPGLYVDGGTDIILERNHVYLCNFAVSVASEHQGHVTSYVAVRDNILHHCHVGGIVMGGSGATNGGVEHCSFTNNTLYDNDTTGYGGGQISIQEYVSDVVIQRNLLACTANFAQYILKTSTTGSFSAGAIDWNYFKGKASGSIEFYWDGVAYSTFAGWKSAASLSKDANSTYSTGALGLANSAPTNASPASDFALTSTSPLINIGDSAGSPFVPATGETDYFGKNRVTNTRVDIGADEYVSP
ncbi:MAG: choice-of-anchor Q domain-containing protein [Luteolibacter sp.]